MVDDVGINYDNIVVAAVFIVIALLIAIVAIGWILIAKFHFTKFPSMAVFILAVSIALVLGATGLYLAVLPELRLSNPRVLLLDVQTKGCRQGLHGDFVISCSEQCTFSFAQVVHGFMLEGRRVGDSEQGEHKTNLTITTRPRVCCAGQPQPPPFVWTINVARAFVLASGNHSIPRIVHGIGANALHDPLELMLFSNSFPRGMDMAPVLTSVNGVIFRKFWPFPVPSWDSACGSRHCDDPWTFDTVQVGMQCQHTQSMQTSIYVKALEAVQSPDTSQWMATIQILIALGSFLGLGSLVTFIPCMYTYLHPREPAISGSRHRD